MVVGLSPKDRPSDAEDSAQGGRGAHRLIRAFRNSPKLVRRVLVPVVALCLLTGAGASAATLASSSSPAPAVAGNTTANAAGSTAVAVQGNSITLENQGSSFTAGTQLTFDYTAATADATNWVGIYQAGQTPGDVASSVWTYSPDVDGSVTLSTSGLVAGSYVAWLFYNDGYTELTPAISFTITAPTPVTTLTISGSDSVVQGLPAKFAYTTTEPASENWIAIYNHGDTNPHDYLTYVYDGGTSGTASIGTAGLQPGTYDVYMLYNNGYTVLAGPVTFTVPPAPVVPQPVYSKTLLAFGPASLETPSGVALDASGDVWATDAGKNDVVEFSPQGRVLRTFGTPGSGNGQLNDPEAIAVSGGDVYVADAGNSRVEEYTTAGRFTATIGGPGTGSGQFTTPEGVAADASGTIYVSDTPNDRIEEFAPAGSYIKSITASVSKPQGLSIDASGDLWVADNGYTDAGGDNVLEFSPSGSLIATLGSSESADYGGMSNPADVALDGQGNVYVAEPDYDLVQEFNVDSLYEGEFGTPATSATGDITPGGTIPALYLPESVASDAAGDVFVADRENHRLVEFVPQVAATVTVNPTSTTVYERFPAILHAEAAGVPRPTVQWQSQAPGATSFTPIPGATSDTLVIPDARTAASGTQYKAVFKNALGTVTTTPATLTVKPLPVPPGPPNHPGGPGAPGMKSWPSSPSWGDIFTWPGVPAWPGSPAGRPSAPAAPAQS
jgi:sugar lactone lactonase YvrE